MDAAKRPPKLTRALLMRLLPRDAREFVVGDMDEAYRRSLTRGRSRRLANRWYRWQAVRSGWAFLLEGISEVRDPLARGLGQAGVGKRNRGPRLPPVGPLSMRHVVRRLARRPTWAILVVSTIALGVGSATTVYSVVSAVLHTPPPFGDPDRTVLIWLQTDRQERVPLTPADLSDVRARTTSFDNVAASWGTIGLSFGDESPVAVQAVHVSTNYFETLQIDFQIGSKGDPEPSGAVEMGAGLGEDVVISHRLWASMFGADPGVLGRQVAAGTGSVRIAGVLPPGVAPTVGGFSNADPLTGVDMWIPLSDAYFAGIDRTTNWVTVVAALSPETTLTRAQEDLDRLAEHLRRTISEREEAGFSIRAVPFLDDQVREARPMMGMLLIAVVLLLAVACANVATVLTAEHAHKSEEAAVRASLGETRLAHLTRVLVGALAVSLVGGGLGVVVAAWGVDLLREWVPPTIPGVDSITLSRRVLLFALVASASTAMVASLLPAVRHAARRDLAGALRSRRVAVTRSRQWRVRGPVSVQIAVCCVLLVGGGLFIRSWQSLVDTWPGFEAEGLLTFLYTDPTPTTGAQAVLDATRELVAVLEETPGVIAAGVTQRMPLMGGQWSSFAANEDMLESGATGPNTAYRWISPGYLSAMGSTLIRGRGFQGTDPPDVVIVDEKLANELWPGEDAVGQRVRTRHPSPGDPTGRWSTVIGVTEHLRHESVSSEHLPTVYYPIFSVAMGPRLYVAVRAEGEVSGVFPALRRAIHEHSPRALIGQPYPMTELVGRDVAATRFAAGLISAFAGLAAVLAAVGLYGVLTLWIGERIAEIGVRRALGAQSAAVARVVTREIAIILIAGLILGIAGSWALYLLGSNLFFGISGPGVSVVLGALIAISGATAAGALPALMRALSISPMRAMRGH